MKRTFIYIYAFIFLISSSYAQKAPLPPAAKDQTRSIIIRKKGVGKEKMTIVIDGDKITINGKPLQDYKGSIQVTENEGDDLNVVAPLPPLPPAMPGGAKFFNRNYLSRPNSAFLGVYTSADDKGACISSVTKNSPADKSGLKEGDIITKINEDNIDDADDLMEVIGRYKPEDKITVSYLRDEKESTITITLEKNNQPGYAYNFSNKEFLNRFGDFSRAWDDDKPRLGISVEDTETGNGVKVTDVEDEDSPAGKAGIQEDDIITQINGKAVMTVKDAKDILTGIRKGDDVAVSYQRKGNLKTTTVQIPKVLESSDL